ncbi:hypothetical protein SUDANB121_03587 [Nocardiopsis dassonvillei]|uniref:hypothetical protein n=1 Tax=Nocardiopsis dassonvillei TaxID=2014 RepID=UPI003F54CC51
MSEADAAQPPERVPSRDRERSGSSLAGEAKGLAPRSSGGAPATPSSTDGGGQVAPETVAALKDLNRLTGWVLQLLGAVLRALSEALFRLSRFAFRLSFLALRWSLRRGRPMERLRIRSRLRSIERAKKRTDRQAEKALGRIESHVAAVRENGDARVREAMQRRAARVGAVRERADRLTDQARRTGEAGVRRARWEARNLPQEQLEERVSDAREARDRRVARAEQRANALVDRVRASADAEVARARTDRDRDNRQAVARAGAALREVGAARTERLADLDRRASEVRDLRGQRLTPRALHARLRADHRQGREATRRFRGRVSAAERSLGPAPAPVRTAPAGPAATVTRPRLRSPGLRLGGAAGHNPGLRLGGAFGRNRGRAVPAPRRTPARVPAPRRGRGAS